MYLKQVLLENNGPLRWLQLSLSFSSGGLPKPLILVGGNGSGKTNFLSLVADALFEAAATHYDNILPQHGLGRAWFRILGGRSLSVGAAGGFGVLEFEDSGTTYFYREKTGQFNSETALARVPQNTALQMNWPTQGSHKEFIINEDKSRTIFEKGIYTYFPSSRSEVPYWLNRDSIPETKFDVGLILSKKLRKPIYVEHALDSFKQWIIGVIADSRYDIPSQLLNGNHQFQTSVSTTSSFFSKEALKICNYLLQEILCDRHVRFMWLGRKSPDKVAVARGEEIILPGLDSLSSGQSILLGIFGTILRYGDISTQYPNIFLESMEGICIIDEIDAHLHVEIQYKVIPKLIKIFPKIQFILSSHSPILVLGMEKEFGAEGIQVIEMPLGLPVGAETYAEFGKALEALSATEAFTEKVIAKAHAGGKPIVYVEGETDAPYLKRAAELLGKAELLQQCDIEWIGSKDDNGQGFHTGKDALKHTFSVLRANPSLASRKILLLHDNDSNTPDGNYDGIFVRKLPINELNNKIRAGIENLLTEDCIIDDFYQIRETKKANGDANTSRTLRKSELCEFICTNGTARQFSAFAKALSIIE